MGSTLQLAQSEHCPAVTNISSQPVLSCQNKNTTTMSPVKQNFHQDSEAVINKQINMELYASYVYLSMSAYFARDDIALHGFAKRFRAASAEEKEHAEKLIDYQVMRGGRVLFREIAKPSTDEWAPPWTPSRPRSSWRGPSTRRCSTCTSPPAITTTPR